MRKKILCIMVALVLSFSVCASAETVDYVQAAITAADHLSGSNYLLTEDGSIITLGETRQTNTSFLAQLGNIKKLSVSVSGSSILALTEDGDLYWGEKKIDTGIADMIYATTNNNEGAHYITADGIKYVNNSGRVDTGSYTNYFVNLAEGKEKELSTQPISIESDKHDFMVIDENGRLFMSYSTSEMYEGLDCYTWENLALVDAARVLDSQTVISLTVAGIQKDGTVLACGDYAEDILSWGPLAYISMADTMIVGLTVDGAVKMTGQYAELMGSVVESWPNIVAIKAGKSNASYDMVTAMDADGNFYYAIVWSNTLKYSGMISSESASTDMNCKKYAADGTVSASYADGIWSSEN